MDEKKKKNDAQKMLSAPLFHPTNSHTLSLPSIIPTIKSHQSSYKKNT